MSNEQIQELQNGIRILYLVMQFVYTGKETALERIDDTLFPNELKNKAFDTEMQAEIHAMKLAAGRYTVHALTVIKTYR